MIRTQALTKNYGSLRALHAVDLEVLPGEILGFLGPNGAGKSTALRILSGFLPPSSGHASIRGLDLTTDSLAARRLTGYLPESFVAPQELRVGEYLRFRAALKGMRRAETRTECARVVKLLGLEERVRQPFSALSKGFRQRVGLADALLGNPPALLLDEPFSGLDPLQRDEFRSILQLLAEQGQAILFSSHVLPEVEAIAHRVLILHQGRSRAAGTLAELQAHLSQVAKLELRLAHPDPRLPQVLQKAQGLMALELHHCGEQVATVALADANQRSELFRLLSDSGLAMVEFRELRPDLEQLFRSLVEDLSS